MGHALDALSPDRLVELGVEADVLGAHGLLRELDDRLHGMGGPLLEGATVHALVQVDGVFTGDDVLEGRARLAGLVFVRTSKGTTRAIHGGAATTSEGTW